MCAPLVLVSYVCFHRSHEQTFLLYSCQGTVNSIEITTSYMDATDRFNGWDTMDMADCGCLCCLPELHHVHFVHNLQSTPVCGSWQ